MARTRRVPYEWILGAMFVASFGFFRWMESWIFRVAWLLVVMPLACRAFGATRGPAEGRPRLGMLVPAAMPGWLYLGAWIALAVADSKYWLSHEAVGATVDFLLGVWPIPAALSLGCLAIAAARPGRYRESAVFLNAAFLLVFAWGFDNAFSPRS